MNNTQDTQETNWASLGLSEDALQLIGKAGFRPPTPVQAATIPLSLAGKDVIASAQTGTGKTASFVLPMVERFAGRQGTFGLILAPTREIAQQTQATLEIFATPRGVRSIVLIGGIDMRLDMQALSTYPQIIVATPGRLCDHLERGNIWLDYIEMVVLDEADRMLDMGFSDQLNRIMKEVPESRQTLLFSATIPASVQKLAQKILHNPERVTIGKPLSAAKTVEQRLIFMQEDDKRRQLMRMLREEPGSIIVFTRSKDSATKVWRFLHSAGVYDATFIHSDRLQQHREQALAEFKEGKFRIMVATDVAARGVHVDAVAHVINFDLPMDPEDYIHRIGRTGRAEATGKATTFATPRDRRTLGLIEKLLGHPIAVVEDAKQSRPPRPDRPRRPEQREQQQAGEQSQPQDGGEASAPQKKEAGGRPPRENRHSGNGQANANAANNVANGEASADGQKRRRRRRRRGGSGAAKSATGQVTEQPPKS